MKKKQRLFSLSPFTLFGRLVVVESSVLSSSPWRKKKNDDAPNSSRPPWAAPEQGLPLVPEKYLRLFSGPRRQATGQPRRERATSARSFFHFSFPSSRRVPPRESCNRRRFPLSPLSFFGKRKINGRPFPAARLEGCPGSPLLPTEGCLFDVSGR